MLWNLINLNYRWLSIIRWNNYPRIQDYVETEHISLRLNIAYIITNILKEYSKEINLVYIYKHIYWSNFFTFIYSDIRYDIKIFLKEKNPIIYNKLRENLYNFLCSLSLDQRIIDDLKPIFEEYIQWELFSNWHKIEHDVISLVKAIETKLEIKDNIELYWLSYENILQNIEENIKKFSLKLWFKDLDKVDLYLSHLIKLKFAYRWNRSKRNYPVSVLSHLFFVFSFSYFLWLLKWFSNEKMEELLNISLLHDLPETLTWDVINPTKMSVPWLKKILEEIEENVVDEKFIKIFENFSFKNNFKKYVLNPFDWEIWKIAKYSDELSAMFEAKIENNEIYLKIYKNIKNLLWSKNDKELDYILKYWVDFFEEDVEEKWKTFIWIN